MWLYDYCFKYKIGIAFISYMNPKDPSVCYKWPRLIIYNEKWYDSNEKPFILAHEIGHIINGDPVCYSHDYNNINKSESIANKFAIRLLKQYCYETDIEFESKYQFAETFGIPRRFYYLLDDVA